MRLIHPLVLCLTLAGCASEERTGKIPEQRATLRIATATPPEDIPPNLPDVNPCTLDNNNKRCPITVTVWLRETGGVTSCGIAKVEPDPINIHGHDMGWAVWRIDEPASGDFYKHFQFRTVSGSDCDTGIDVVGNTNDDFARCEPDPSTSTWWSNDVVRRRVLNKRPKVFHYNVRVQYRKNLFFSGWAECDPLDPVIVNRD